MKIVPLAYNMPYAHHGFDSTHVLCLFFSLNLLLYIYLPPAPLHPGHFMD